MSHRAGPPRMARRWAAGLVPLLLVLWLGPAAACGGGDDVVEETAAGEPAQADERARTRRFWELYREANDARVAGRRGAAIRGLEAALELAPEHGDALHYLAQLRLERDEVGRARQLLGRLVDTETASLRGPQQLALALGIPRPGWAADLPAALKTVRRAVEINPENSGPRVLEARLAAYLGDDATSREAEADALQRVPGHAEAHALAIWRAMAAGRSQEALGAAQRALAAACSDPGSLAVRCADHSRLHLLIASLPRGARPRRDDEALAGLRLPALVASAAPEVCSPSPRLTVRAAPAPVETGTDVVRVDLDGDGAIDLLAEGRPARPARLTAAGTDASGPRLLPAGEALANAWARETPGAIPWRGAFVEERPGRALILVGGGSPGVRLYRPAADEPGNDDRDGDRGAGDGLDAQPQVVTGPGRDGWKGRLWRESGTDGLPAEVPGAVLAAADWNGDGATDLFLGNLPAEAAEATAAHREPTGGPDPGRPPVPDADMVARLFVQVGAARFEAVGPPVPGPLQAALATDVDGDGDPDLLVARKVPPEVAAHGQLLLPHSLRGDLPEGGALAVWRNDDGRLVHDPAAVPFVVVTVQDLAASDLDEDGMPEVYVATGSLVPEYPEADRLLRSVDGRFMDVSHVLGAARLQGTLRVWARSRGFELLRGGTVPADPPRQLLLAWARGTKGCG